MTSNVDLSVQQIEQDFQALIAYVTGPETRTATAYTVELTLFQRLLALGAALLRLFFQTRAAERPAGPVHAPDGTPLGYHDRRFTTYYAVFGKVRFARHYCTAVGQEGRCPSVPAGRRPEPTCALLLGPAARVGDVWHDGRVLSREPGRA
jgi:hypothetical protein